MQICLTSTDEVDSDRLSLQASILSDATTFTSQSSDFSRRASVDTLATSRRSSITSVESKLLELSPISSLGRTTEETPLRGPEQKPSIEGPSTTDVVITRRACRYDCYCECHVQSAARSTREFMKSKGSKTKCTQSNCRRVIYPEEQVHGTAFFRRALSQVLSSKSIKIRYDLNTYRMVSEGSDAMRYVKHGQLDKLKACIKSGEATLWDTAPDGWSLLHVSLAFGNIRY